MFYLLNYRIWKTAQPWN